ncbi:MAG: site-2 protease family protein [Deltaproteobacteria bacterium]|nr:site-2 protease family protein [Deltaproteobacteria bacterium]
MFKSWRLGRLLGFPIEINASFLVLLGVVFLAFGGLSGVIIVSLAFGSVLLHELGHALVARKLRVHVTGIELGFLGGAAKMEGMPRNPNQEIAIAAAGPAVSLALAALGLGLGALTQVHIISVIGWINLALAVFNLIPALPMDGGRILRAALAKKLRFVRATEISVHVSRAVAIAFGVWALAGGPFQLLILAPYLWLMAGKELEMAKMVEQYQGYESPFGGHMPRRYTITQVGGRLVITATD